MSNHPNLFSRITGSLGSVLNRDLQSTGEAQFADRKHGLESLKMNQRASGVNEGRATENAIQDSCAHSMLLSILGAITLFPEMIEVLMIESDGVLCFEIRCAAVDLKRLIGHHGDTVRAIRSILSASATRKGRRYTLRVNGM